MAARQPWEIEQQPGGFRIRVISTSTVQQQPWIFVPCSAVKQVSGIYLPGYGDRLPTNQRRNPIRENDQINLIISFHDENNTSPIEYNILYVDNQAGWTPDLAGLQQAITDVSSWCGGGGAILGNILLELESINNNVASIGSLMFNNVETPSMFVDTASGAPGATNPAVNSVSLLFEGANGEINGNIVDSGYQVSYAATLGNVLASISYKVPSVADAFFPNSPRVVIQYVS